MQKRGRPKIAPNAVRQPFTIRITPAEKKSFAINAKRAGQKPAEWARNQLLAAAAGGNP